MKQISTKERIIKESLTLFSRDGYESVSVEKIASAVGIKAPSLYKHFKSKQDIFDTLCRIMVERYDENSIFLNTDWSKIPLDEITEESMTEMAVEQILRSLHDPIVSKFRKLLTIEQYRNKELSKVQSQRTYTDIMNFYQELFKRMIAKGIFRDCDVEIMTVQFVSPISILLFMCDREPEQEEHAKSIIARHIHMFWQLYQKLEE